MDNVVKLNRGYAWVYVHTFDEAYVNEHLKNLKNPLNVNDAVKEYLDQIEEHLLHDYYTTLGSIQWNYYWIIKYTGSVINEDTVTFVSQIKLDDTYCRKLFINDKDVAEYTTKNFPSVTDLAGSVTLIETTDNMEGNHYLAIQKALELYQTKPKNTSCHIEGIDTSNLNRLKILDLMRISVISGTNLIYATQREDEAFLFKNKFDFLGDKFKHIEI